MNNITHEIINTICKSVMGMEFINQQNYNNELHEIIKDIINNDDIEQLKEQLYYISQTATDLMEEIQTIEDDIIENL